MNKLGKFLIATVIILTTIGIGIGVKQNLFYEKSIKTVSNNIVTNKYENSVESKKIERINKSKEEDNAYIEIVDPIDNELENIQSRADYILNASEKSLLTNQDYSLKFAIYLSEPDLEVELYEITDNGEYNKLINLEDVAFVDEAKGINEIGGDGIYTGVIEVTPEVDGTKRYCAIVNYFNKPSDKSKILEIKVYKSFTYEEFADMEGVNDYLQKVQEQDDYIKANVEKRAEIIIEALDILSCTGHVKENSYIHEYVEGADVIGFEYISGAMGGVQIKDFDPMMN